MAIETKKLLGKVLSLKTGSSAQLCAANLLQICHILGGMQENPSCTTVNPAFARKA
jgi:hypothetical protein